MQTFCHDYYSDFQLYHQCENNHQSTVICFMESKHYTKILCSQSMSGMCMPNQLRQFKTSLDELALIWTPKVWCRHIVRFLYVLYSKARSNELPAVREKYSHPRYLCVAALNPPCNLPESLFLPQDVLWSFQTACSWTSHFSVVCVQALKLKVLLILSSLFSATFSKPIISTFLCTKSI